MTDGFMIPQQSQAGLRFMAELERSSKDTWMVINPTEQDFIVWWNKSAPNGGERWTIPNINKDMGNGKGQRTVPQYIMVNYVENMTKHIMTSFSDQAVKDENDRRVSKGMAKMNKWEEQLVFETQPEYNLNNEQRKEEIALTLVKGIVEHYGMDTQDDVNQDAPETRPMIDRLIERFRKQPLEQEETILPTSAASPEENSSDIKINDLRAQVRAKGEKVDMSMKKDALIAHLQGDDE